MIDFFRTMLTLPAPWLVWVGVLMTANMVFPLFYLDTLEGKVVLAAFAFGAIVQTAIFSSKGFVRLLGVGHIAWIPMVIWLWPRVGAAPPGGLFRYWLLGTSIVVIVSLVIDATDVVRYARGEREPQLETPDRSSR